MRPRHWHALPALLLMVTACSAQAAPPAATAPPRPVAATPTASETPTPAPSPTPEPEVVLRVPADTPVKTDADVRRIYDQLVAAGYAQAANPDPELVDDVWDERCPCFHDFRAYAEHLVGQGLREVGPVPHVLSFEVLGPLSSGDGWALEVVRETQGSITINEDGSIVKETPPKQPERLAISILRSGGLWRFGDVYFLPS